MHGAEQAATGVSVTRKYRAENSKHIVLPSTKHIMSVYTTVWQFWTLAGVGCVENAKNRTWGTPVRTPGGSDRRQASALRLSSLFQKINKLFVASGRLLLLGWVMLRQVSRTKNASWKFCRLYSIYLWGKWKLLHWLMTKAVLQRTVRAASLSNKQ